MAFDKLFGDNIGFLISTIGTPISVSRGSATIFKTDAVFVGNKTVQEKSDGISLISRLNNMESIAYIGTVKTAPAPGDKVIGKNRTYKVLEVEAYQPALINLGYKLRKFKREWASEAVTRIQQRTPVRTGDLQGGWGVTMKTTGFEIYNTKDYAAYVEYGTPKMAPVGMVRTTLLEKDDITKVAKERSGIK
jgi:hypothetical protein